MLKELRQFYHINAMIEFCILETGDLSRLQNEFRAEVGFSAYVSDILVK